MEHTYFDTIKEELENAVEEVIAFAIGDCESVINNYNELDEDDREEYQDLFDFATNSIDSISTVDEAIDVIKEIADGEANTSTNAIDAYEEYLEKFKEEESNIDKVLSIVSEISNQNGVINVLTSSKSISTYVIVAPTFENYNTLKFIGDLEEDYYSEQCDDLELDIETEEGFDKMVEECNVTELKVRISNHNVGTYYNEIRGEVKYDDHNVTILI